LGTSSAKGEIENGSDIQAVAMEYAALATGARRGTAKAAHKAKDGMVNSLIDYRKRATLAECEVVWCKHQAE
jgi:hypothetical protein